MRKALFTSLFAFLALSAIPSFACDKCSQGIKVSSSSSTCCKNKKTCTCKHKKSQAKAKAKTTNLSSSAAKPATNSSSSTCGEAQGKDPGFCHM